jgi:hypothetical protein
MIQAGRERNACGVMVRKRRIRILGRPRHSGEKNIEVGCRETGWEGVDWIQLAEDNDK